MKQHITIAATQYPQDINTFLLKNSNLMIIPRKGKNPKFITSTIR